MPSQSNTEVKNISLAWYGCRRCSQIMSTKPVLLFCSQVTDDERKLMLPQAEKKNLSSYQYLLLWPTQLLLLGCLTRILQGLLFGRCYLSQLSVLFSMHGNFPPPEQPVTRCVYHLTCPGFWEKPQCVIVARPQAGLWNGYQGGEKTVWVKTTHHLSCRISYSSFVF